MSITIKTLGVAEGTLIVPAISIGDGLTRAIAWLQDEHDGISHGVAKVWWVLLTHAHAKAIGDGVVQDNRRWWHNKDSQNYVHVRFDVFIIPTVVADHER